MLRSIYYIIPPFPKKIIAKNNTSTGILGSPSIPCERNLSIRLSRHIWYFSQ